MYTVTEIPANYKQKRLIHNTVSYYMIPHSFVDRKHSFTGTWGLHLLPRRRR